MKTLKINVQNNKRDNLKVTCPVLSGFGFVKKHVPVINASSRKHTLAYHLDTADR